MTENDSVSKYKSKLSIKFNFKIYKYVVLTAIAVIFVDQISKTLVYDKKPDIHIFWIFYFRYTLNSGAAFSLFSSSSVYVALIAAATVVVLIVFSIKTYSVLQAIGFGLIIGGAISNLSDRVFRHLNNSVIDFIYTKYWPTFNVADSCITIGIVVIIISYIRNESKIKSKAVQNSDNVSNSENIGC